MAAILEIKPESRDSYRIPIGYTATIGRAAENDVSFPGSSLVSRQHAILRCHNGSDYQIMDLGSRNGTYVDGHRVVMPVTLRDEAVISIGGNLILFRSVAAPRYADPDDVTIAAAGTGSAHTRIREVAILVCDIRGFSSHSERLPAPELARVLGNWFRESGNRVQQSGGTIDKFIGDAMLAYWTEAPAGGGECGTALRVADELLAAASRLSWPESADPFQVGIALHRGTVSSGNIGLVAQRDATIIGDAVNIAFRLEGLMKQLGLQLILSEAFAVPLGDISRFEDQGEHLLKGKSVPVRVFGQR